MTCIVGLEHNKRVYIGGDSAAVSNWDVNTTRLVKVFRLQQTVIGYSSSFRMGQLLQYNMGAFPLYKEDDMTPIGYLVAIFIPAVRKCLKEGGFTTVENEVETGGFFLVGFRGKVYEVANDFQVNSRMDGIGAVGSGYQYALASLYETKDTIYNDPKERVMRALKCAEYFNGAVCKPFVIEEG